MDKRTADGNPSNPASPRASDSPPHSDTHAPTSTPAHVGTRFPLGTRSAPRPARPHRGRPRTPRPRGRRRTSAPIPDSHQRILSAATAEFALRGFEAATVDRIASRARLNKAMIYYHFHSKRALYSTVIREILTLMGDRLAAISSSGASPIDKLDRFVATFVTEGERLSHVAPIMLREIAEGGRRLDEETYTGMARVTRVITAIVEEGRAAGQFVAVDPILLYLTTVWPIVVYLATSPIRKAIARVARFDASRVDPDRFIRHLQTINRRALMPAAAGGSTGDTP
jgi:AcrR family transcriptional regulator